MLERFAFSSSIVIGGRHLRAVRSLEAQLWRRSRLREVHHNGRDVVNITVLQDPAGARLGDRSEEQEEKRESRTAIRDHF